MSLKADNVADVRARFTKDIAEHTMEVLLDQDVYRHLKFRRPGTYCMGFDIVTWPGHLAISGDLGTAVFSRLHDMLEFFRASPERAADAGGLYIDVGYWAEKCEANDGEKKVFSEELFRALVKERFDEYIAENSDGAEADTELWDELDSEVLAAMGTHEAISAMDGFESVDSPNFKFVDAWEYASSIEDYTFHFIWRLFAIAHAVKAYDIHTAAQPEATAQEA